MLQVEKQLTQKFELVTREYVEHAICRALEQRILPDYGPFFGDDGVQNWLALEASGSMPFSRRLTTFLKRSLPYFAEHFIPEFSLVSIGAGDGTKDRILFESLLHIGNPSYYSIDISSGMIDTALNSVADLNAQKTGLVGFFEDLPILKRLWCPPVLLCLLGNKFSDYNGDYVLSLVRAELEPPDLFLFDARLFREDDEEYGECFASPSYVRFQLAPLIRRGLNPGAVEYVVSSMCEELAVGPVRRVDRTLRILRETVVAFNTGSVSLLPGERVELGSTYQYTLEQIREFVCRNRLSLVEQHVDQHYEHALFMLRRPAENRDLL